ncbi:MAG: peptidoglycan editing factor PgeF [Edaphobacter sp.]|nr:peptidoglycan editing factor PgeF [Edaphobacter sp.]
MNGLAAHNYPVVARFKWEARVVESDAGKGVTQIEVVWVGGGERYGWLRHGFSTRMGGVSTVYGGSSLNLGWTKEDDPSLVAENRRRFVDAAAGKRTGKAGFSLVTVRQIHSGVVQVVREGDGALEGKLQTADGKAVLQGDGLMTNVPGVMLGVGTADCVPVLVVDGKKRAVAAFHAGWRGTVARIVEHGIARMRLEYGSQPEDLFAAVGPSIGACCYAVGEEVRSEFVSKFAYAEELFHQVASSAERGVPPQLHVDLWEANRRQLLDAGVKESCIAVVGECSACARDEHGALRYFSHRGEHGVAGRMMSVVGICRDDATTADATDADSESTAAR